MTVVDMIETADIVKNDVLFRKDALAGLWDACRYAPPTSELEQRAVASFIGVVVAIADAPIRMTILKDASRHVHPGSELERQVVSAFLNEVATIADASKRLIAFRDAAWDAPPGGLIAQIVDALPKDLKRQAFRPIPFTQNTPVDRRP